jgi:hypothetical protein
MSTETLTPAQFVKNGSGLNITPLLQAPTGVTLEFSNTGHEVLFVVTSASAVTVQLDIGATVLGQAVTNPAAVTLTESDMYAFGPYDSPADQPGTNTVEVTLSTITGVTVALLQMVGAA